MSIPKYKGLVALRPGGTAAVPVAQRLSLVLNAIDQAFNRNISTLSFEEIHRNCYQIIVEKQGKLFLDQVTEKFTFYAKRTADRLANIFSPGQFMEAYCREWEEHKFVYSETSKVAMYADKHYVVQVKKTSLLNICIKVFRDNVILNRTLLQRLREVVLDQFKNARDGEVIDRFAVKSLMRMVNETNVDQRPVYEEEFESSYLLTSQAYFESSFQNLFSLFSGSDCLRKINETIDFETQLCNDCNMPSTLNKFNNLMNLKLVDVYVSAVLKMENSGCQDMVIDDKIEDLSLLRQLSSRTITCFDLLRNTLKDSVIVMGEKLLNDLLSANLDSIVYVQNIIKMREKMDNILTQALNKDRKATVLIIQGFEKILNKTLHAPIALAHYVDFLLRSKEYDEISIEPILNNILTIFSYLSEKDVFEVNYRKFLMKRQFDGKHASEDLERAVISRLKKECGQQFTGKLEGMLLDVRMSSDYQPEFEKSEIFHKLPHKLSVQVLTTGFWPIQVDNPCVVPESIAECGEYFRLYYFSRHTGRQLKWIYQYGTVEIKAKYPGREYMLLLSFYQMLILLQYNGVMTLSIDELERRTGISLQELKRHIHGLCNPKLQLLQKVTKEDGSSGVDYFTVNVKFTSNRRSIAVPSMEAKKNIFSNNDSKGISSSMESDRQLLIDSSVVRIMKSRKTATFLYISSEVTRQLSNRFVPDTQALKKSIERLIEREYIRRDDQNVNQFHYIA